MANLVMCGLSVVMSVAAMAISLDTMRMNRQVDRWLDKEQARLDEETRRRGHR